MGGVHRGRAVGQAGTTRGQARRKPRRRRRRSRRSRSTSRTPRRCFELIDKDEGGTLDKGEIVRAVKEDAEVISFLETCGEENLQFLLVPIV